MLNIKKGEIREVRVSPESEFAGKTILEADIHEKTGVVVVGIGKKGKLTIDPPRDFVIEADDMILAIGKMEEFERMKIQDVIRQFPVFRILFSIKPLYFILNSLKPGIPYPKITKIYYPNLIFISTILWVYF